MTAVQEKPVLRAGNSNDSHRIETPKRKTAHHIREILTRLFFQHGCRLPEWADYPNILAAEGLTPDDISPGILEGAKKDMLHETKKALTAVSVPLCSIPVGGSFDGLPGGDVVEGTVIHLGSGEVKVDVLHIGGRREVSYWSAQSPVLLPQPKFNHDTDSDDQTTLTLEQAMYVNEKSARSMLVGTGHAGAKDWSVKKLTDQLNGLKGSLENGATKPTDADDLKLFDRVLKALDDGKEIMVGDEAPAKHAPSKNGKPKASKPKAAKAEGAGKDRLGCRLGGLPAKINAAITRKQATFEAIAKEAGCTADRVKGHVRYWIRKKAPLVTGENGVAWK